MLEICDNICETLNQYPFIIIVGKYDQILGPRALYSSIPLKNEDLVRDLLRDALNTKNKYVILDFDEFYSQICKIEVEDNTARGGKQLYAIIIIRLEVLPIIPILHLKRIEMMFYKLGTKKILTDNEKAFDAFFKQIKDIYMKKDELLPLESKNLQIRSGVNTIQGFCELVLEQKKRFMRGSGKEIIPYIEMMLEACKDITDAIENDQNNSLNK